MTRSEPDWSKMTAVFGGTFDPPHLGHWHAVAGVFKFPGVARVRVIPAGAPALKTPLTSADDRLRMARLLFSGYESRAFADRITVDDREIRAAASGTRSYTAQTLEALSLEVGSALAFVIGTDQLADLPRWHRFPELLGLAHWIVLKRQPEDAEAIRRSLSPLIQSNLLRPTLTDGAFDVAVGPTPRTLRLVSTTAPALSSTQIRREFALHGKAPKNSLNTEVERYLKEHRLYGT